MKVGCAKEREIGDSKIDRGRNTVRERVGERVRARAKRRGRDRQTDRQTHCFWWL